MWERFTAWAIPARLRKEGPDTVRRARLLLTFTVVMFLCGVTGVPFLLTIEPDPLSQRMLAVAMPTLLACAVPVILRSTGSLTLAGNIGAALAFFSIGLVAFQTGGLGRPIMGIQALVPLLAVLVLALSAIAQVAHAADAERVLVMNAHLISRAAPKADVRVNLLVVDGRLAVVTKDVLVVRPGDVAVDASGGFLFGELILGQRPSFMILDQDPRDRDASGLA